ncbi:GrpB family protein [Brevibacillus sp. LEMMJ03]|uniref:GrpB family protein n=1 Tax=Brevibacillus sp. LEMMJ03 TaxID=2595056 RepID=UPI00117D83D7|nr:GrpB family protein [Brevibacillus sp. LEMMJ03]TRY24410.1 GrpB family protein [Brevibacillus sp. LEMMJ03]
MRTVEVVAYDDRWPEMFREEAAAYRDLKRRLAERFPADIAAYVAGKDAFVKALEQRALAWWNARRDSEKYGIDEKRG